MAPGERRRLDRPVVCVLVKQGRFLTATPLLQRGGRMTIPPKDAGGARPGSMVLVGGGKRGPRVIRPVGDPERARDVVEAIMLDGGLRRSFPRKVDEDARNTPVATPRRDLTELPTFTIDPASAQDFDDAISARHEEGRVRLWVHIADVTAYVRPGTAVDAEAYRRGTSVYVPGAVEPMLPPALSNEACSLVPHQDRSAVTVELEMEAERVVSASFHRTVIRSDARLEYGQVDRIFAGEERAQEPWAGALEAAREVAAALRDRRARRGSLEVESDEAQFEFDEHGDVVAIHRERQTESHTLIEELMILANEQVATVLADRRLPTLYRVHERPDPARVELLVQQLESLEVPTPPLPDRMSPQQAADAVGEISRRVAEEVRQSGRGRSAFTSLVLRSLKQAYYTPQDLGHAGLASERYLHFTSPIRRYPDVIAHRALLASIGADDVPPRAADLDDAGLVTSAAEREAMQIERDADDACLAFLLERALTERGPEADWEGEVVGVIGAGCFVRFGEEGFEGFLPARKLRGEWWSLNEEGTALVGEESGRALRMGDPVRVEVAKVFAPRGRVDLLPIST
ncbi:MAG TPA: RNB domain-containing ribonuclease [Thermoleophilaceae bacterium]|nr:RNB domain-containing ribonuclease [Thermoleophilaceae bacterium]